MNKKFIISYYMVQSKLLSIGGVLLYILLKNNLYAFSLLKIEKNDLNREYSKY